MPVMKLLSSLFLAALGALSGCSNQGALGQAAIGQGGSGAGGVVTGFDAPVAAGASVTIAVDLSLQGGGAPPLTLLSANEDVLTVAGETLTGVTPGIATLLLTSEGSVVLDFTAIWVQSASELALQRLTDDGAVLGEIQGDLGLVVGDSVPVSVSALSATQPLVGAPPATWSADPPIVALLDEGILGRERVVAQAAGTTTVTVSALKLTKSFVVEVTP
jgi:hypothetical protein